MFSLDLDVFTSQAVTLSKWLIAIPSVSGSEGEAVIMNAVHEGVCEFEYFHAQPQHLRYIPHQDGRNHSLVALVRCPREDVHDTVIIIGNTDTTGNDGYGTLKSTAFHSDELRERLKTTVKDPRQLAALNQDEAIYGLGSYESKCAAGALVVYLKECSDRAAELPLNLLFIFASHRINGHLGMRECLGTLHDMMREYSLNYRLAVNFAARAGQDPHEPLPLFTSNLGLVETGFYIIGRGAEPDKPFSGFSPSLVASLIIHKTELNPRLTHQLSKRALIPSFRYMHSHGKRAPNSPDAVQLGFSLPFKNLSLADLLEELKQTAARAIEEADVAVDERHAFYNSVAKLDYERYTHDAEVVSFTDLWYRASRHYRSDLSAAIASLRQKCLKDGMDERQIARTVLERLNDLAHLPSPSVVVYLGADFVPQQRLSSSNSTDRELYIKLHSAAESFQRRTGRAIELREDDFSPTDSCFIRPVGIDPALKVLEHECPVPVNRFYNLGAPTVTLCLDGDDLYLPTEHFSTPSFRHIPAFLEVVLDSLVSETAEERAAAAEQEEQIRALTEANDTPPAEQPETKLPLGSAEESAARAPGPQENQAAPAAAGEDQSHAEQAAPT